MVELSTFRSLYIRMPQHYLATLPTKVFVNTTIEVCSQACVKETGFECKSFDFDNSLRGCRLHNYTYDDVLLRVSDHIDHYRNGVLGKFINFGQGTLRPIEGIQVYNKIMLGVTLESCAKLCLGEQTFKCMSFDYIFSDQSCQMSEYLAANVYGVDTSLTPENRVMHYERKETYLEYFYATPYSMVLGENEKTLKRVTPDRCARSCLEEKDFVCRSFDYQIQEGTCLLSTKSGSDVGGLFRSQGIAQVHHFELKPFIDCGGVLEESSGGIASPNWPRKYSHHLNCTWDIKVPNFKIIKFEFIHFDLGTHPVNPCDETSDRLLFIETLQEGNITHCTDSTIVSYTSMTNHVIARFITNAQDDAQGFRAFYVADWPCGGIMTSEDGELASPGWPVSYSSSKECEWIISAPARSKIRLKITSIDLEKHQIGFCNNRYDVLEVFDGASEKDSLFGKFCGSHPPISFTSSGNVLLVKFKSDDRVERKGFHAIYTFVHPSTSTSAYTTNNNNMDGSFRTSTEFNMYSTSDINMNADGAYSEKHIDPSLVRDGKLAVNIQQLSTTTPFSHIIAGDGGGIRLIPSSNTNTERDDNKLRLAFWVIVGTLAVILVIVFFVLVLVLRHYRKRLPKRRNNHNYAYVEENVSLYEKDNMINSRQDEAPNTPATMNKCASCSPCSTPDISFSNPVYEKKHKRKLSEESITEQKVFIEEVKL